MTLHMRVGQRVRLSPNLEIVVLAISGLTVKLGVADCFDPCALPGSGLDGEYYLFSDGERWLVSGRAQGDRILLGGRDIRIVGVNNDRVAIELLSCLAGPSHAQQTSVDANQHFSSLVRGS